MENSDQELWNRVRERLKSNVGDDIFNSWFARMELEAAEGDTVRLSVPTRFLKSWVQSHYVDRLLTCWQDELTTVARIELTVRSAVLKPLPPKPKVAEIAPHTHDRRELKIGMEAPRAAAPISPRMTRSAARRSIRGSAESPRGRLLKRQHAVPSKSRKGGAATP
jgi:chromosomal replication initiator protein